ncbi:YIP1 family protein [Candidatus Halobonum tyrrellensis]|uniref:YIP1 family protein n=1 Tax=Candidatus Halobonum tyrrellensis TaxID=1431545 RepID=UPI000677F1E6|nr:YIP1 family protein [Candidatus Halobonum tyrrellensis]
MTTWVENPSGGRARGPRGLARAWAEVLVRPARFFRTGVAPGDQAPGLVFAVCVALAYAAGRFLFSPATVPGVVGDVAASAFIALAFVAVFVAPAVLHLTAAVGTVSLLVASLGYERGRGAFLRGRAGVSETVQVIAYASAPCALAGPPIPELRAACALYGAALLTLGVREVHATTTRRALVAAAPPAALLFGWGFRGAAGVATLLTRWYVI